MRWADLPVNPSDRMLRQFAGLCIVVFGGLAMWQGLTAGLSWRVALLAGAAVAIGPLGLIAPKAIRPLFIGWLALAFPIGWVISRVLLLGLFALVMTPVGFVLRMAGRDPLQLRRQPHAGTYWKPTNTSSDLSTYFRQF